MSIHCADDLFDISPGVVVNEAVFSIRVKSHLALDYEELRSTNCTITAKEAVAKQAKTTTVPLLIRIRDVNDHIPQFSRPSYQVCSQRFFSPPCIIIIVCRTIPFFVSVVRMFDSPFPCVIDLLVFRSRYWRTLRSVPSSVLFKPQMQIPVNWAPKASATVCYPARLLTR